MFICLTHPHDVVVFLWLCSHAPRPTQRTCWNCSLSYPSPCWLDLPEPRCLSHDPWPFPTWPAKAMKPCLNHSCTPFLFLWPPNWIRRVSDLTFQNSDPLPETSERPCVCPLKCVRLLKDFLLSGQAPLTIRNWSILTNPPPSLTTGLILPVRPTNFVPPSTYPAPSTCLPCYRHALFFFLDANSVHICVSCFFSLLLSTLASLCISNFTPTCKDRKLYKQLRSGHSQTQPCVHKRVTRQLCCACSNVPQGSGVDFFFSCVVLSDGEVSWYQSGVLSDTI